MESNEILKASFLEVIEESLLNDSSFYAQMSLKFGDNKDKKQEHLDLSKKYYDALEWFKEFIKNYPE